MNDHDVYDNPLVGRYASPEMARLWSPQRKFSTWRRVWLALAEAQHELGLRGADGSHRVRPEALDAMRRHLDDVDFERASQYERRFRHDVMAHLHAFGECAPEARDVLHLGATSCDVTDNADLVLIREALGLTVRSVVNVIDALGEFAGHWRDLPTLGFTHFQPAQLTTVGKRACLWCADFVLDLHELERRLESLPFRGLKGATGTQASFLALFDGDAGRVRHLEQVFAAKLGFGEICRVTGQTYSRKLDSQVLDTLSGIAQSAHKFGTDLRLLAHRREVEEPFEAEQVGSSAMAYKRNPMRAERMCGLARFVSSLPANAAQTASVQWLERTLDDSVNRRLTLPQAFLATDAVLRLATNVARGLVVHPEVIRHHLDDEIPFMATENLLMAAVAKGQDRQVVHECIRRHSLAAVERVKRGERNDLLDRLSADSVFASVDVAGVVGRGRFTGLAAEQTDAFLRDEVEPIRRRHSRHLGERAEVNL